MPLTSLCILSALSSNHMTYNITPTSSISLTSNHPTTITNIDSNPLANTQAQALCKSLGGLPSTGMKFITSLAGSNDLDLSSYDIVWFAALVGGTQEDKENILQNVVRKMRKGSLLVMRGVWGLRSVLYCVCHFLLLFSSLEDLYIPFGIMDYVTWDIRHTISIQKKEDCLQQANHLLKIYRISTSQPQQSPNISISASAWTHSAML